MADKFFGCKHNLKHLVWKAFKRQPVMIYPLSINVNPLNLSSENVFGFEVEIENLPEPPHIHGWTCTIDGSLRNNGKEYVSNPTEGRSVTSLLDSLFENLPEDSDFHPRAGIHIHVNCLDMALEQVQKALLYYYLLEPAFFKIADTSRKDSVFCVPLKECNNILSYLTLTGDDHGCSKYAALNRLPLFSLGTLEFRHLQSTSDRATLDWFVQLVDSIATAAKSGTDSVEDALTQIKENPHSLVAYILKDRFDSYIHNGIVTPEDVESQAAHFLHLFAQKNAGQFIADSFGYTAQTNNIVLINKDMYEADGLAEEEVV